MIQDLRFGIRILFKSPGFTALALLTLALGIGANTTMFSVVNSVLLRPLPYENPSRIVQVQDLAGSAPITASYPRFSFVRDHARSFSALAAVSFTRLQLAGPSPAPPEEVTALRVSANLFKMLGVKPVAGRWFLDSEDRPGANPAAIIGYTLWRNRFGGDPSAIGKTVSLDGISTPIVGVMPPGFDFTSGVEVWVPKPFESSLITPKQIQNGASYLLLFARLADGVDPLAAEAELRILGAQYDAGHRGFGDAGRTQVVIPLRETFVSDVRRILLVLLGAVGFVLLIASANVANLLLARAIARRKEVAIRASLGASRRRLLLQFLVESVVLSAIGAALGLLLASWSIRLIAMLGPRMLPRAGEIHLDGAVLAFTAGVAFVAAIVFGLGPALHASRVDLNEALKAGSRTFTHGGRLRGVMVAAEVAFATILLAGAGLLLRSFLRLESVDPGFRPENLTTMRIGLAPARYTTRQRQVALYNRILESASAIPGVRDAALASGLPVNGRTIGYFYNIEGRPVLAPNKAPAAFLHSISRGYFRTLGIPLIAGRAFSEADNETAPPVAIINQTMARRHWPYENPVGKHITYSREGVTVEIVGVAGDVKLAGLGESTAQELFYVPYRQRPFLTMWLLARGPSSAAAAARRAIAGIDPEQPVTNVGTMEAAISDSVSKPRRRAALIGSFAALALALSMIGIAGVVAWSVSQRTGEIGIRMALGAGPAAVSRMIVRDAFAMIGAGQLIGLLGALALTRVLATFLFGVSPEDPLTFAGVLLGMGFVALATCLFGARRALRVDPVIALRAE